MKIYDHTVLSEMDCFGIPAHNGTWASSDLGEKWWPELFLPGFDLRAVRDHWDEEAPAGPKL